MNAEQIYLTASEAADLLNVRVQLVYRWLDANRFEGARRLSGVWLIPRSAVDGFKRKAPPPAPKGHARV